MQQHLMTPMPLASKYHWDAILSFHDAMLHRIKASWCIHVSSRSPHSKCQPSQHLLFTHCIIKRQHYIHQFWCPSDSHKHKNWQVWRYGPYCSSSACPLITSLSHICLSHSGIQVALFYPPPALGTSLEASGPLHSFIKDARTDSPASC